jgi:hypothetical protein
LQNKLFSKDNIAEIKQALENTGLGLKIIPVPGIIEQCDINFMNAIVHQRPNGGLVYITNKSNDFNKYGNINLNNYYGVDFNEMFQKYLMQAAPFVKRVEFIEGSVDLTSNNNYISKCLRDESGGVHCMVTERPDFDRWA